MRNEIVLLLQLLLLVILDASCFASSAASASAAAASDTKSVVDDSNRCKWMLNDRRNVFRFSAMPGTGWDNLRNKEMSLISDLSFADCSLSDDGNFILPKSVLLYPHKQSSVSVDSQIMEHYNNYTDSLSVTVNVGGKGFIHSLGIGGKFSEEYQRVKSKAIHSKTQIARTQLRYHVYTARLQADAKLSTAFADRLIDVANAIINNNTKQARYLSDLIVRDFGTHVITSVSAGGMLERTDFFDKNSIKTKDFMQNSFSAAMSVNFLKVIGVNFDTKTTVTKTQLDEYVKSVKNSAVTTHGGPIMGAQLNVSQWEKHLMENLVAIDRDGEPLYNVISQRSMPSIPFAYLMQVIGHVRDAVQRYYKANVIKGCLNPNSANFDPTANVDGHCQTPNTNFSFGGVYQTCRDQNPGAGLRLCDGAGGMFQQNPITGKFSCPSGYEAVKLLEQTGTTKRQCTPKHKRCWGFFSCRDGETCVQSSTTLTTYWCSVLSSAKTPSDSGMVFAGLYSKKIVNPVTNSHSCPSFYRPFRLGAELFLCLSRDFAVAAEMRIPLGGFFSCKSGNPLAEPGRHIVSSAEFSAAAAEGREPGQFNSYPKRCPDSFSQMTVNIIDGCSLMICEKYAGQLSRQFAKRPPFESPDFTTNARPVAQISDGIRLWTFNLSTQLWAFTGFKEKPIEASDDYSAASSSSNVAVPVALVSLLIAAIVVSGVVIGVVQYRKRRQTTYRQMPPLSQAEARGYGAVSDGDDAADAEIDVSSRA